MQIGAGAYVLGWILGLLAVGHAIPIAIALSTGETTAVDGFVTSFAITAFAAGLMILGSRGKVVAYNRRLALVTLLAGVIVVPAAIGGPFYLTGVVDSFAETYFEGASALTTTGASLLGAHHALPRAVLAWRIMTEWFGGLLTLVAAVAVLPVLDVAGIRLASHILPHGAGADLLARIRSAFHILGRTYVALTAVLAMALWISGLPFEGGLSVAMTTMATGGFLLHDGGLGYYANGLAELLVAVGLLLAALNITLVGAALRGRPRLLLQDVETKTFFKALTIGLAVLMASFWLEARPTGLAHDAGLWDQVFLTISVLTTSGMTSAHTTGLPLSIGIILIAFAVLGGSTLSTTGGIKALRVHLVSRFAARELARLAHPHGVFPISVRGRSVTVSEMTAVWVLCLSLLMTAVAGALALAALKVPFLSAIATAVAMLTGTGPLAALADPAFAGFGALNGPMMWVCSLLMITGRLEIVLLLVPLMQIDLKLS